MSLGIVITRHVRCENTNKLWNECYRCIRKWYPNNIIMIVDDASNYQYVSSHYNLVNCFIIQSEFPGSGELLGFYYFHKYHLFSKAIVIHDSSFLNGQLCVDDIHTARFIWHFSHEWNIPSAEIELIKVLHKSDFLFTIHRNTNLWKGAFGTQCVITYEFLDSIVNKYRLFNLFQVVKHRNERCQLERVFGLICCAEDPSINNNPSIMGLIHDCEDFGTVSFDKYSNYFYSYDHLVIIKTWVGR
uniref:Glycosyltransferase n=1 Tax=viral metagenome TaxID=1070528 RepID=A0A6C0JXJ7_9ZZZZ